MSEKARVDETSNGRAARIGLYLGPALAVFMLIFFQPEGLEPVAWRTAAAAVWMAVWWSTEAVPVPVTALLPLVLFAPLDIMPIRETASSYAHPTIYLFLGGFMLAAAIERWNLHRRIALNVVRRIGTSPPRLLAGFMTVSAALSMWITNTSTTMMLLPIVVSVTAVILGERKDIVAKDVKNFRQSMLLGVAHGSTIGGVATLIGTPPNAFLAGFMESNYGVTIGFAEWMKIGLPLTLVMLPLTWLAFTRLIYPVGFSGDKAVLEHLKDLLKGLGKMGTAERRVAVVFFAVALSWMFRKKLMLLPGLEGLSDAGIAIAGAVLLFIIPSGSKKGERLMNWERTAKLPWGILILFGGGLALAGAVSGSGLAAWLGNSLAPLGSFGLPVLLVATVALVIFLTELTSNLATTATFLPVVAAVAIELGADPMLLAVPVTLAASWAFMLPIATPPNAIVFSSGHITIPHMARSGLVLNLMGIVLLSIMAMFLVPLFFG
jgi:sodium-dependent dicarboxylate transporter 2/3/5